MADVAVGRAVGSDHTVGVDDLWSDVIGQDVAVAQLRAAAASPVHAYLLVGPEGSGTREAALAFAADLLSDALDVRRASDVRRRTGMGSHPCLTVVERVGPSISADQMKEVVRQANLTPAEGDRQVIVLIDFHLVTVAAPILLKTLEEPPPSTVFVVLAEEVTPSMSTIASRCVQIEFTPVAEPAIAARLVAEGVDPRTAEVVAAGAGGSMTQARLLSRDPSAASRRELWHRVPDRLDGTGSTAAALVEEVLAATELLAEPLTERHAAELAEFEEIAERTGGGLAGDRRSMVDRHRREQRRVRTADLRAGLAALVARYREALLEGAPAEDFLTAADAVQELCDGLSFNVNTTLQLQSLFVSLPRLST